MTDRSEKMRELVEKLNTIPTGPVSESITDDVKRLLGGVWEFMDGSGRGGMKSEKINRAEKLRWDKDAQYLTFVIERHGAIVAGGSSRAELQTWAINITEMSAAYSVSEYRRARNYKPPSRIDNRAIVREIANAISTEKPLEGITRQEANVILISPGHFIPGKGLVQTLSSRRRKFRSILEAALNDLGWVRDANSKPHNFRKG